MKTLLVPVDFSPIAYNAAEYAIGLAKQLHGEKIILYNAYQQYISEDPAMIEYVTQDMNALQQVSDEGLKLMNEHLAPFITDSSLQLKLSGEYNHASSGILEAGKENNADMIVMGINHENNFEAAMLGSNTIAVSKHSGIPVLIVPPEAKYNTIKNVLLAVDSKEMEKPVWLELVKKILDDTNAALHILRVEGNEKSLSTEASSKDMAEQLFSSYKPVHHSSKNVHFADAINECAAENNIDLIISFQKKHGWFEGLFKPNQTKQLAFHTNIPLLTLHE